MKEKLSCFFPISDITHQITKLDLLEVETGKILGKGEFGKVMEVTSISLSSQFTLSDNIRLQQARIFMGEHYLRENDDLRYAMKMIRGDVIQRYFAADENSNGNIFDVLAIEVKLLRMISHPNIIKLRATSYAEPNSKGFFIIIDRLNEILTDRIYYDWRNRLKRLRMKGFLSQFRKKKIIEADSLLCEQLLVAKDLSSAMGYLHDKKIVYRDLKPGQFDLKYFHDTEMSVLKSNFFLMNSVVRQYWI